MRHGAPAVGSARQRHFDQRLRFRARDQRRRSDPEGEAPELALAQQVGQRLVRCAPAHQVFQPVGRVRAHRALGIADQRRHLAAEDMHGQQARLQAGRGDVGISKLPPRLGHRLADGLPGDAWLGVAGLGFAELADHTASARRFA